MKEVYGRFRNVNLVPWRSSRRMPSPSGHIACGNTSEYTVGAVKYAISRHPSLPFGKTKRRKPESRVGATLPLEHLVELWEDR